MYIEYIVNIKGIIRAESLNINLSNSDVKNCELFFETTNSDFDILFIRFYFNKSIQSEDEAKSITIPLVNDLINVLIYTFNVTCKVPVVNGFHVANKTIIARGSIPIYNLEQYQLTEADCNWLSTNINDQILINKLKLNPYFLQYKSVLTIEDSVSRYLLLYGLLYEIKGDQDEVDKYIKSKIKKVIKRRTTKINKHTKKRLKKRETIYTWWRNQAQHMQNTTDIEKVAQQFKTLENSLRDLVYDAIKSGI